MILSWHSCNGRRTGRGMRATKEQVIKMGKIMGMKRGPRWYTDNEYLAEDPESSGDDLPAYYIPSLPEEIWSDEEDGLDEEEHREKAEPQKGWTTQEGTAKTDDMDQEDALSDTDTVRGGVEKMHI